MLSYLSIFEILFEKYLILVFSRYFFRPSLSRIFKILLKSILHNTATAPLAFKKDQYENVRWWKHHSPQCDTGRPWQRCHRLTVDEGKWCAGRHRSSLPANTAIQTGTFLPAYTRHKNKLHILLRALNFRDIRQRCANNLPSIINAEVSWLGLNLWH